MSRSDRDTLKDIKERHEYAEQKWLPIRREAQMDMQYVSGDPWTANDRLQRKDRPIVAPEEMGQYFNQVINQLRSNPRGMKFAPNGNGANDQGARFYQNKARETEYRSHAKIAYITAAENAIQRSYGFLRLELRYQSPRSVNQDIWIEGFPDPDMVLPDPDAKRPDSSDMQYCFVDQWDDQKEFKRAYPDAKLTDFGSFAATNRDWIVGTKVRKAEYWTIQTRLRKLLLVQPPALHLQAPNRLIAPPQQRPPQPMQVFEDEFTEMHIPGARVLRELREVDYPEVFMYLTNGIEILHDQQWSGKYIPIVSCYGKVLFVPNEGGESERKMLSMTRFGRDPWKSMCYCDSQALEILGQVPRASIIAAEGQLAGHEAEWAEAPHVPKAYLIYKPVLDSLGGTPIPPPQRAAYMQSDNLQATMMAREVFRQAVQSAMGSNFLPSAAKQRDEKSGVALGKIDQSMSTGTFHFIDNYDGLIRQTAVIYEDLLDKVLDYTGETNVMEDENTAKSVRINDKSDPDAIDVRGDYLVTVSTGPSSDSERDSVEEFTNTLVSNLPEIAQIAGPEAAKQLLGRSIRFRNGGPMMDQIADIIDPPPPNGADGKPIPPELQAAHAQIKTLQQQLQQAGQVIQTKQVEQQGKMAIAQVDNKADLQKAALDRETKLAVAEIQAQAKQALQDMALFYEERSRIGAQIHERAMGGQDIAHNVHLAKLDAAHQSIENTKDRIHEHVQAKAAAAAGAQASAQQHAQGLDAQQQAHEQGMESQQQAADLAPEPTGA